MKMKKLNIIVPVLLCCFILFGCNSIEEEIPEEPVTIDTQDEIVKPVVEPPVEIPETPYGGYNREKMMAMFQRFGFDSLHAKLTPSPHKLALY